MNVRSVARIAAETMFAIQLLSLSPQPVAAQPAITCHCFTERSFDGTRPAAADPYLLATTQNSFLAQVFGVDKMAIVVKKQQGVSSDDLWIAYRLASLSGTPAESLLQTVQQKSWAGVVADLRLSKKRLGARFAAAVLADASAPRLAAAVVDDLLLSARLLGDRELVALRRAGATNQEAIIAAVVAAKLRQPPPQLLREVRSGSRSWGSLVQRAGIDVKEMQREIGALMQLRSG